MQKRTSRPCSCTASCNLDTQLLHGGSTTHDAPGGHVPTGNYIDSIYFSPSAERLKTLAVLGVLAI